jgi:hypothetical protein
MYGGRRDVGEPGFDMIRAPLVSLLRTEYTSSRLKTCVYKCSFNKAITVS